MTRRPEDLRRALDARSAEAVDTEGMLAGIRSRIALRRARRRRAAVAASAGAALLIAAVPIVVNQLDLTGDDATRSAGTSSATESPGSTGPSPTTGPTVESPGSLDPAEVAFTVPTLPAGYRPVTVTTTVGEQTRAYTNFPESPQVPIDVTLFDPQVNGGPTPTASAETVELNSATAGPITAYVGRGAGAADDGESIDVYWEVEDGRWVSVVVDAGDELALQRAIAVAEQVDLTTSEQLTFPFQIGYLPAGFGLNGASRLTDQSLVGGLSTSMQLDDRPSAVYEDSALLLEVVNRTTGIEANTTVGAYQAVLTETETGRSLTVLDVNGMEVSLTVNAPFLDRIDEAELRRIAESITVPDGAAADPTVWTTDPLP